MWVPMLVIVTVGLCASYQELQLNGNQVRVRLGESVVNE